MLVVVAIFLVSGPVIVYIFSRRYRRPKPIESSPQG
jgi:hypothetical protein